MSTFAHRCLRLSTLAAAALALAAGTAAAAAPPRFNMRPLDAARRVVALPDGISMAYVPLGDPRGTPVVLIHGYTDSDLDWTPLIPYLSKDFRLIVVDLRGHGESSKPQCCYTRYDFAYDVKLLLDKLHVRRADIVGHSLGSIVAQTFAEVWPMRTRRVVLISSTAGPPPKGKRHQYDWAAQIRRLKEPLNPDSAFMRKWWWSPHPVNRAFLRRERENAAAIPLSVWLAVLDQSLSDAELSNLASTLPRLEAPTLLLWGSADPIMLPAMRRGLERALPHAKVVIFPGLGHNLFWEKPRACAAVINAFLDPAAHVARYGAAAWSPAPRHPHKLATN